MRQLTGLLALLLFSLPCAHAQKPKWRPDFLVFTINTFDLSDYLAGGIRYREEINLCKAEAGYFYFRVNGRNQIDSIRYEGSLRPKFVDIITSNIYSTANRWTLPAGTKPENRCWFVYPFFIFGYRSSCSETDRVLYDNLAVSSKILTQLGQFTETRNGFLLRAHICDPPSIR